ncbi:uncharacterized protein LOC131301976 [Rhododendron vialii]|uniref:uncharacterized protein LOC131301976 n=1 Tax=Rhododendron vialii TaxID=182163 RepID=UPI0026600B43|nr:uncharacterized protein LOC131301976 [Rhododendron vialii]
MSLYDHFQVGTTPVQGPLGATNGLQTSTVVGNNYGGPSGMTVDGGQPHRGTKLPVKRKMKVVEKRPAQVVEIGLSEVLETGPTQSSITTQLQGKGKRVQNKMMWLGCSEQNLCTVPFVQGLFFFFFSFCGLRNLCKGCFFGNVVKL